MQRANPKSVTKETRPTLVSILHSEFNNKISGYDYEKCIQHSREKMQQNDFQRFFDVYPPLLSADDMNALRDRYIDILRSIDVAAVKQDDNHKIINNWGAKDKIDSLIRDIASLAAAELLEPDMTVKKIIFTFLKIKPEEYAQFDGKSYALTSAFVGATMIHLQNLVSEYIERYSVVNHGVDNYMNNKLQGLIQDGMKKPDRNINLREVAFIDKAVTYVKEHKDKAVTFVGEHKVETGVVVTAMLTLGIFGVAVVVGGKALVDALSNSPPHKP